MAALFSGMICEETRTCIESGFQGLLSDYLAAIVMPRSDSLCLRHQLNVIDASPINLHPPCNVERRSHAGMTLPLSDILQRTHSTVNKHTIQLLLCPDS